MYYVYLLRLKNNEIYTGSTPNVDGRYKEHCNGYVESTKNLRPLKLIAYFSFEDRLTALRFEKYLKTGSGQAFRNKRLIKEGQK